MAQWWLTIGDLVLHRALLARREVVERDSSANGSTSDPCAVGTVSNAHCKLLLPRPESGNLRAKRTESVVERVSDCTANVRMCFGPACLPE